MMIYLKKTNDVTLLGVLIRLEKKVQVGFSDLLPLFSKFEPLIK